MPSKRKAGEDQEEKKSLKMAKKSQPAPFKYDFFHDKPEYAKDDEPIILVSNGERLCIFPQILESCSPKFMERHEFREIDGRTYVNLDDLDKRGVRVFANWAMDHQKPVFIASNDDQCDLLDDIITCYAVAHKLRAKLLCDLILHEACEICKQLELRVRLKQIQTAYAETTSPKDGLREFLAATVAYQRRNGLSNPITGKDAKTDKQRFRFNNVPQDFQFDLMSELSKESAGQDPCYSASRFVRVVIYFMQKKGDERRRAVEERAQVEVKDGTADLPLFVEDDDE